jgi:feruloyl esterase
VVVGKEVTRRFFGVPHTKSFYLGCSTGGRQGLKSVQDFPEDFDGVVAGAPAADWNHLMDWSGNFFLITGPPSAPTFLSIAQWLDVIHPDILKQCDGIDGVMDGIIEDANLCNYDPSDLICAPGQNTSSCITEAQAETVHKVFSPFFIEGQFAYPRYQPGAESTVSALLLGGTMFAFTAVSSISSDARHFWFNIFVERIGSALSFSMTPTLMSTHLTNLPSLSLKSLIHSIFPHSKETSQLSKIVMVNS